MTECSPTLNAAAGMSGNNRPFIVQSFGFDSVASGDTNCTSEISKCLTTSHGRNGAGVIVFKKHLCNLMVLNFMGSKGNNVVTNDNGSPALCTMHGNDTHVVALTSY